MHRFFLLFICMAIPLSAHWKGAVGYNYQQTFSDEMDFEPGGFFALAGGTGLGNYQIEGEFAMRVCEASSGCCETCSKTETYGIGSILFNAIYQYPSYEFITTDIGAGVGVARSGRLDAFFGDESKTEFAFQFIGGLSFALTRCKRFGLDYRLFGTSAPSVSCEEPSSSIFVLSHSIAARIEY